MVHISEDNRITALLFQKSVEGDIEQMQDFQELASDLSAIDSIDPVYVVDCLEGSGLFNADILTLEKRHAYRPNDDDYDKLKRFTRTPSGQNTASNRLHELLNMGLNSELS